LNLQNDTSAPSPDVPQLIVTLLVVAVAAGFVIAQFYFAELPPQNPGSQLALANMDKRIGMLRQTDDPVQRDSLCIPLAASARRLDTLLPKDARIFMTGMVGHTNQGSLGYYYFFRNYLFPRDVEISLDKGHFGKGGFYGITTDSPDVLRTNGFDLMINFAAGQVIPLTPKGVPNAANPQ
jgi:hypothetical protein